MIEHVYRRAAAARGVDAVVIATDDGRIADAVERFGGVVRMTSPAHRSGLDRVAEVAAALECDVVVNVQGDEPLIEPAMISEAVDALNADDAVQMSTLRRRVEHPAEYASPHVVKVVTDTEDNALYFSRAPIPFRRSEAAAGPGGQQAIYKHIGLYAYKRSFLLKIASLAPTPLEIAESLEQLRALEHGFRVRAAVTTYDSIGVDTPEDLERVRRHLAVGTSA